MATRDNEVAIFRDGPFRFSDLPAEVRLTILESSDLLTPTLEVQWDPVSGYKAPPRWHVQQQQQQNETASPWRPPRALFLVSRSFYEQARRVFFQHNRFTIWSPVMTRSGGGAEAMYDQQQQEQYAATTFFDNCFSFHHLRHLELPGFTVIVTAATHDSSSSGRDGDDNNNNNNKEKDSKEKEKTPAERALSGWFLALRRARDDLGLLNDLRFLRISGFWADMPIRMPMSKHHTNPGSYYLPSSHVLSSSSSPSSSSSSSLTTAKAGEDENEEKEKEKEKEEEEERQAKEHLMHQLRDFITTRIWPTLNPTSSSSSSSSSSDDANNDDNIPRLPRQLLVEMHGPSATECRYSIRRAGEGWDDKRHEARLGVPTVSRRVSWKSVGDINSGGSSNSSRSTGTGTGAGEKIGVRGWVQEEDGEWVEEAWFKTYFGGRNLM